MSAPSGRRDHARTSRVSRPRNRLRSLQGEPTARSPAHPNREPEHEEAGLWRSVSRAAARAWARVGRVRASRSSRGNSRPQPTRARSPPASSPARSTLRGTHCVPSFGTTFPGLGLGAQRWLHRRSRFLCVLRSGAVPSTWGVFLPNLQGTINVHRGDFGALPRAPLAFVRGLWCLLPRWRFSSEPPFLCPFSDDDHTMWELRETEPQPSSVLANRWQWALLGTRAELGLATSGPCWAERRLRPGEAHTWGGRLAGRETRGGPAPRGTDAAISGSALFQGGEMLDRPPGERVQPGHQGVGTPNPGHRRSTEETQTPGGDGEEEVRRSPAPTGEGDRGGHLHRGAKWPRGDGPGV